MAPGRSEHGYEFTPDDLAAVARADLVVYIGLSLEPRIAQAVRSRPVPGREVVVFAEAVGLQKSGEPEPNEGGACCPGHAHDKPEPGHVHRAWIDQHLWLDPVLCAQLIPTLKDAVARVMARKGLNDSARLAELDRAASELADRVNRMDAQWRERLEPFRGRAVVTHHNAFGRPAERYGFVVAEVIREVETAEPTPQDIAEVIAAVRERNVRAIFVEPQFSSAAAQRIAQVARVRLGRLDPLGDGDWFRMMQQNLDSLLINLAD
jgi:zinc transport system substrate-binding protein